MLVDACGWLLMVVDGCWWPLMAVDCYWWLLLCTWPPFLWLSLVWRLRRRWQRKGAASRWSSQMALRRLEVRLWDCSLCMNSELVIFFGSKSCHFLISKNLPEWKNWCRLLFCPAQGTEFVRFRDFVEISDTICPAVGQRLYNSCNSALERYNRACWWLHGALHADSIISWPCSWAEMGSPRTRSNTQTVFLGQFWTECEQQICMFVVFEDFCCFLGHMNFKLLKRNGCSQWSSQPQAQSCQMGLAVQRRMCSTLWFYH